MICICTEPFLEKSSRRTYNGDLDVLDFLPHLLHLTLQLLWRLHNLRLEFADVLLQAADVHLHLSLRGMGVSLISTVEPSGDISPRFSSNHHLTHQLLSLLCKDGFALCDAVILGTL